MNKPIFSTEFWKKRIKEAQRDYFSVYVTNYKDWRDINIEHLALIREGIPEDAKVLDAGCGYGRACEWFSPSQYTGVDFSPDFLGQAKRKYPEYTFVKADLRELPFEKKQFDWAFCISIKRMVVDNKGVAEWKKMEKELKRVAKNVLILEYEDPDQFEIL